MIEIADLKKGLRVVLPNGMKGPVVKWEIFPSRFFYIYGRRVDMPKHAHVLINHTPYGHIDDMVTWGAMNKDMDVDLDYYNELK